jgi:hypothetical protein
MRLVQTVCSPWTCIRRSCGIFDIPVDNLFASPVLLQYIKQRHDLELMVVSPDTSGLARAGPLPVGWMPPGDH